MVKEKKMVKLKRKRTNRVIAAMGVALIILGFVIALLNFAAYEGEVEETKPNVSKVADVLTLGGVLGIIFVAIGGLLIILDGKG